MTEHPTGVRGVRIIDNGLRSFVPPCFCFELRAGPGEGHLVATVSQIVLPTGEVLESGFAAGQELGLEPGAPHDGFIEPYEAGPRGDRGARFTVTA
ncbi:hypothetical protein OUY22_00380 [Nonomuraea sp. MCN248]|uniref:DUF35 domain-containing protein n=1 Tax=Nonomuraea corallina TaxID=2989783 RepID=A0ABT4S3U5_9ACTN|nr:hypothetical protein [Nonomuraea corallina]MDA0631859.1 hypothetical protein [Nonomuraea corallina]